MGDIYDEIYLASNPNGLFKSDLERLNMKFNLSGVSFFSYNTFIVHLKDKNKRITLPLKAILKISSLLLLPYNFFVMLSTLRKFNPSMVLCCNGGYPASRMVLLMVIAARILRKPTILSIVSMPFQSKFERARPFNLIHKIINHSADVIIVNAYAIANALEKNFGFSARKMFVVHNGLPDRQPLERVKKEGVVTIGCVTRLDYAKGILFLLESFRNLCTRFSNLELILSGEGDLYSEIKEKIKRYGLESKIKLLGYYDGGTEKLLASFDIFVFPSLWEGFPYSILEAMRAGLAIVTTDVGGIPEAIKNEQEGLLVQPAMVNEMERALERLVIDAKLRKELGDRARDKFKERFEIAKMHQRIYDLLKKTIRK